MVHASEGPRSDGNWWRVWPSARDTLLGVVRWNNDDVRGADTESKREGGVSRIPGVKKVWAVQNYRVVHHEQMTLAAASATNIARRYENLGVGRGPSG